MRLKESKNLHYDRLPWIGPYEGYEKFEPEKCFLKDFNRVDDKLILYFKNSSQAVIKAVNIEGGREMDIFESKLKDFLEKNYADILNINL